MSDGSIKHKNLDQTEGTERDRKNEFVNCIYACWHKRGDALHFFEIFTVKDVGDVAHFYALGTELPRQRNTHFNFDLWIYF